MSIQLKLKKKLESNSKKFNLCLLFLKKNEPQRQTLQ